MADQQTQNGQAPSSWGSAVDDVRDMGLKYMNAALNAAGGQTGGITRNQFNFPAQPATGSTAPASGLSGLAKTGLAAAGIFGTGGLGVGIAALMGVFNAAAPAVVTPPMTPPAAVQSNDDNIGVKADLIVTPPGAAQ